jgi:hypothetical protein
MNPLSKENHADLVDEKSTRQQQEARVQRARSLWLYSTATSAQEELEMQRDIELAYQETWDEIRNSKPSEGNNDSDGVHLSAMIGERLALLLIQNHDRWQAADTILRNLGYTCRLSRLILNYCDPTEYSQPLTRTSSTASVSPPCRILDCSLSAPELECLQSVFLDPNESYWTFHKYCVEPPSPYVSYIIPLQNSVARLDREFLRLHYGSLGCVILRVLDHIQQWKPSVVEQATTCELWAHNRPNTTGHQLHFDSDNEGLESIRHPMLTAILCLSEHGTVHTGCGAPTLLTTQRLASRQPSDRGWLAFPKPNRLILMDGRVLHGVIPGKRPNPRDPNHPFPTASQNRRVTVMLAFWKRIRVRDEPTPGAARPFPTCATDPRPQWAEALTRAPSSACGSSTRAVAAAAEAPVDRITCALEVDPRPVSHVYDNVDNGKPWTRSMGMPAYDEVFQGI